MRPQPDADDEAEAADSGVRAKKKAEKRVIAREVHAPPKKRDPRREE